MNYYLITYQWRYATCTEWTYEETLIDTSPIKWLIEIRELNNNERCNTLFNIISTTPISKEIYIKYKDVF